MSETKELLQSVLRYLARGDAPNKMYPDKKTGEYWTLCPFHSDNHATNFSVSERGYNCFACDAKGGVTALAEHFGIIESNGSKGKGKFDFDNIVARYHYHDADGHEVYQVWRDGNKEFLPTWGHGQKGTFGYPASGRVLYHLPEVLSAETVYLCEGEKSADAVRALELTATTIPGGGTAKWFDVYTQALTGRNVVLFPDNDDTGRKWEHNVRAKLTGKAATVKTATIPGLKHRQDIEDYIKAGHGRGDIEGLELHIGSSKDTTISGNTTDILEPQSDGDQGSEKPTKGKRRVTSQEYLRALAALGYTFRMNETNDVIEVGGDQISDPLAAEIRTRMRDLGYTSIRAMEDAYTAQAFKKKYHPVKVYLEGLTWDRQDHIAELSAHFTDALDAFPLFFKRWAIGAVAKVYQAEQNRMLVLDGAQDLGKSHFVRWLASPFPDLFIEGPIIPESKDDLIRLASCFVWEVAELGSTTRKADREALKHFLSRRSVTVRRPYGHYDMNKPALASFIGTVNNEGGFLSDPTGNRRFMVCNITEIEWSYTALDVDQIWAQAHALYQADETWVLKGSELDLAQRINAEYEIDDPLVAYILDKYDVTGDLGDYVSTVDLLTVLHISGWRLRTPRAESMALGAALKHKLLTGIQKAREGTQRGYTGLRLKPLPASGL